jgi:hypothetical protein
VTALIEYGALARTTTECREGGYNYYAGMTFTIEDHVTAEEAEADDGFGYYYGSNNGGMNNVEVREDHVEAIKSREEMDARTIPTIDEVAAHIGSEAHGGDLGIHESDWGSGDGVINLYGTTEDGLGFAAVIKVLAVERTDF